MNYEDVFKDLTAQNRKLVDLANELNTAIKNYIIFSIRIKFMASNLLKWGRIVLAGFKQNKENSDENNKINSGRTFLEEMEDAPQKSTENGSDEEFVRKKIL